MRELCQNYSIHWVKGTHFGDNSEDHCEHHLVPGRSRLPYRCVPQAHSGQRKKKSLNINIMRR